MKKFSSMWIHKCVGSPAMLKRNLFVQTEKNMCIWEYFCFTWWSLSSRQINPTTTVWVSPSFAIFEKWCYDIDSNANNDVKYSCIDIQNKFPKIILLHLKLTEQLYLMQKMQCVSSQNKHKHHIFNLLANKKNTSKNRISNITMSNKYVPSVLQWD